MFEALSRTHGACCRALPESYCVQEGSAFDALKRWLYSVIGKPSGAGLRHGSLDV